MELHISITGDDESCCKILNILTGGQFSELDQQSLQQESRSEQNTELEEMIKRIFGEEE